MQLQIDVNNLKANIFLEMLKLFKQDNMINDYKILDEKSTLYDQEILDDLQMFQKTLQDAQHGVGIHTNKTVKIQDL